MTQRLVYLIEILFVYYNDMIIALIGNVLELLASHLKIGIDIMG